jgi:hypothetical protein
MNLKISLNKAIIFSIFFVFSLFVVTQTASATITGISITSPNGGEHWNATQNITWSCTDDAVSPKCSDTTINDILYSPDGGTTWEGVGYTGSSITADAGTWSWDTTLIPNTESTNGIIKIVANSPAINDQSDASFSVDNTKPTIQSVTTNDSDGNGKVDQLIVVFDETMDNSKTSTADFAYTSSQGATPSGAAGTWSTTTNTDNTFTIPLTESAGTCDYSSQAGCDTDDTSSVTYSGTSLTDLANNAPNNYSASTIDGAKPAMIGAKTDDTLPAGTPNGQIDTITIWFSEDIDGGALGASDFTINGYTPVGGAVEGPAGFVTLTIPESGTPDTDVTPLTAITSGGGVKDLPGNELLQGDPGYSITPTDGAAPVAVKAEYFTYTPGTVDRFRVYYSEDISTTAHGSFGSITNGNVVLTSPGALTGFISPTAISDHTDGNNNVYFATGSGIGTTNLTGANGGSEPTWSYTYDGVNTLQDAAGNLWEYIAPGADTMVDAANPIVIDDITLDTFQDGYGDIDTLELRFSEYVDDSVILSALSGFELTSDNGTSYDTFSIFNTATADLGGGVNVANDDYIAIRLHPNNVQGTGVVKYKYTNNGNDLNDLLSNPLLDFTDTAANDGAAPVVTKLAYIDTDHNGTVETVDMTVSETLSTVTPVLTDFTIPIAGDITLATGGTITQSPNGVLRWTGLSADADETGGATNPKIAYTQVGSVFKDAAGNDLKNFAATEVVDEAQPIALDSIGANDSKYTDGVNAGVINRVVLEFTEDIKIRSGVHNDFDNSAWTETANGLTGFDVNGASDAVIDSRLFLLATSSVTGVGAAAEPTLQYGGADYGNATIEDITGNTAAMFTVTLTDDADPVLTGFTAAPNPASIGDNLNFTLTFSEPMDNTVALTNTTFDIVGSGAPGPYTTTVDSYVGNTWAAHYTGNPISTGTPESGTHTFSNVTSGVDPVGNPMVILSGLDLTFVIDSARPETTGLEIAPSTFAASIPTTVTATVSDDIAVNGAKLYIDAGATPTLLGSMTESQSLNGGKTKTYMMLLNTNATFMGMLGTLTPGDTYSMYVVGEDSAGNKQLLDSDGDGVNDIKTETITISDNTSAPVLTLDGDGTTVNIDADTYTITGSVTPGDFTVVKVFRMVGATPSGANDVYIGEALLGPSESHWEVLTGLTQNATSKYYAEAHDLVNNTTVSGILTVVESQSSGIDTISPWLSSTAPSTQQVTGSVAPIVFTFGDDTAFNTNAILNIKDFVLDGSNIAGSGNTNVTVTGSNKILTVTYTDANLAVGVHNFNLKVKDAAGNTREASLTVDVVATGDTTPPTGAVSTTATTVNADSYVITGILTADSDNVTVTINNGTSDVGSTVVTAGGTSWSVTVPLPQNTATTFTAKATDGSANTATLGSVVITEDSTLGVDNTAPVGTISTTATTVNADFFVITGTLTADSDDVTVTINNGTSDVGTATVSAGNTSWSVTVPLPQNMATTFTATAKDPSANSATIGSVVITEDSTGPVDITGLSVSGVTDTAGTINWSADATPDSASYRVSTSPYSGTWVSMAVTGASGTQAMSGLSANTTYYYQVKFVKNSQTVYSSPLMFTTANASTGLSIDSIQAIKSYATADDSWTNGWKWRFNVTLNDLTETNLALKFDQWVSGTNTLDAANNMRYSVDDATWTTITANGAYPTTDIDVSAIDTNPSAGGRQVTVYVEMKVPTGTTGGSYSTSYGVRAQ